MRHVILRGGYFSGLVVLDLEPDINGVILTAHYGEILQSVLCRTQQTLIYTNTMHSTLMEIDRRLVSCEVFEIDFRAMRENFQYELFPESA
jgi:hypothetical protein